MIWMVPGYWRMEKSGKKVKKDYVELTLPDLAFDTRGVVFDFNPQLIETFYQRSRPLLEKQPMVG